MCASDRLARFASPALGSLRSRISNSLQVRKGGNRMRMSIFVLLAVLIASTLSTAQEFRGTISGAVTDSAGAAVPNVQVVATEISTGTRTHTVTNGDGEYTLPFLLPGDYEITAQVAGFKVFIRKGVHLASPPSQYRSPRKFRCSTWKTLRRRKSSPPSRWKICRSTAGPP
jgi:hypothetical protein